MNEQNRRQDAFRFVTGPIRQGTQQVHLYNEGLVLFYYDESRLPRIDDVHPEILEYFNDEVLADPKLDPLLEDGSLVIQLLAGDGGADLEVVIGNDLSDAEKSGGRWLEPRSAWIALPSGRLRIETYNSAPFSDGDEDGGAVQLPPGHYRLTVHSKDWAGMEEKDSRDLLEEASEAGIEVYDGERVDHVVVLSPLAGPPKGPSRGVLFEDLYVSEPEGWPSPEGELLLQGESGSFHHAELDDDPQLNLVGEGMRELGLEHLGDFVLDRFGGIKARGWGSAGSVVYGVAHSSPFSALTVDLYTRFADGASLTTSTIAAAEDPGRGIYRRHRTAGSVAQLHETHQEALKEHAAAGRSLVETEPTLLGLARCIDEFMVRQAS